MRFILYLTNDHEACVGEVPTGKTVEQFIQEVNGAWIHFGERRRYRTREEAEDDLRGWVSPGGPVGTGDPTPVR